MNISIILNTLGRIVAVFGMQAMAVVGGAAVVAPDIKVHHAALVAGISSVAQVVQKLCAGYADDGKLDIEEINDAFSAK